MPLVSGAAFQRIFTRLWWPALLVGVVIAVYGRSLGFDLIQEDYAVLRPWTSVELTGVFHGTWDPTGRLPPFYRPLAAVFYAADFYLFGLNTRLVHAVSLVLIVLVGAALAAFVRRETSRLQGRVTSVLLLVHPAFAAGGAVWITGQMQLLSCLAVLATFIVWQWCRTRSDITWLALLVPLTAGLLIKEDAVMAGPAVMVLQFLRAGVIGDVRPPSRRLILGGLFALTVLFGLRYVLLGGLGGYGTWPQPLELLQTWQRGPRHALLTPLRGFPSATAATVFVGSIFVVGSALLWRRWTTPAGWMWICGLVLVACVSLPLVQHSTPYRYALVAMAGSMALGGALTACVIFAKARLGRDRVFFCVAVGLTSMALAARGAVPDWHSCSDPDVEAQLAGSPALSHDYTPFLAGMIASCRSGTFRPASQAIPLIGWHLGPADADGLRVIEDNHATWLVTPSATRYALRLRAAHASAAASVRIVLTSETGRPLVRTLQSPDWQDIEGTLGTNWLTRLRTQHRLDLRTEINGGETRAVEIAAIRVE